MPESGITHLRAKRYDLEMANYHICEISNYLLILLPLKKQKEQRKKKDITKYLFNNRQLCKRELVLQCVKQYVKEHENLCSQELLETFPNYIQGSLGVVKKVEDAEWYTNAKKRYYFSDEDIIHLSDGDYVICTQWDASNIGNFLKLAEDIGYEIQPITRKYK